MQKKRSSEISSIFLTFNNSVQPHGCSIYNTAADMAMETICLCNSKHHWLPYWKCFCVVVVSAQLLSYPVRRQIKVQQTRV